MKFLCLDCDEPMKLHSTEGPDEGSLAVTFRCPECGFRVAMLTNPFETQMVRSLGVKVGGGAAAPAPFEHVRTMMANPRADAFEGDVAKLGEPQAEAARRRRLPVCGHGQRGRRHGGGIGPVDDRSRGAGRADPVVHPAHGAPRDRAIRRRARVRDDRRGRDGPGARRVRDVTKADIVARMAAAAGWPKAGTERALRAALGGIRASLKRGDAVTLVGFGTFSVARRKPRTLKNPRTGQAVTVAGRIPRFKPSKELKQAVR